MMENGNINGYSISDNALLNVIRQFIQDTRLRQNKSQPGKPL